METTLNIRSLIIRKKTQINKYIEPANENYYTVCLPRGSVGRLHRSTLFIWDGTFFDNMHILKSKKSKYRL